MESSSNCAFEASDDGRDCAGTAGSRGSGVSAVFSSVGLVPLSADVLGSCGSVGAKKLRLNRKIVPLGGDDAGLAAEQDQTAKLVERDIRLPNGIGVREEFSTRRRAPRKEISERNAVHPPDRRINP